MKKNEQKWRKNEFPLNSNFHQRREWIKQGKMYETFRAWSVWKFVCIVYVVGSLRIYEVGMNCCCCCKKSCACSLHCCNSLRSHILQIFNFCLWIFFSCAWMHAYMHEYCVYAGRLVYTEEEASFQSFQHKLVLFVYILYAFIVMFCVMCCNVCIHSCMGIYLESVDVSCWVKWMNETNSDGGWKCKRTVVVRFQ